MKWDFSVEEPLNQEPSAEQLISSYITNSDIAYHRNHGPIPYIDGKKHVVTVDGLVGRKLVLSVSDLQIKYAQYEVTSALQCAGNRRHTMRTLVKEVNGIDWGSNAVMNCKWRGAKLRDVLLDAGVDVEDVSGKHVAFSCHKVPVQGGENWYGGSIELKQALREEADVLVTFEMNGKPLPVYHGFPVRIVVPGVSGCRSVKWLDQITVQSEESINLYQRYDYKILPPEATDKEAAAKFWSITPPLQDMPVNSAIAIPQSKDIIKLSGSGTVEVKGYALPQGDQGPVRNVEVSSNEGKSWIQAELLLDDGGQSKWAWVLWRASIKLEKGKNKIILSRAIDKGGNVQPDKPPWNLRGVAFDYYGLSRDLEVV